MSSSARIDELRKKFDENPRRFFAPLANEYRKAGDFEQAVFICQEYLPQQPGHMSGHIVYGQTLFDMGRDEEAKAVFETALTLDPENLIALKHLGDIARQAGDLEGARSWYQRVLEADPRNDEIMQVLESLGGADVEFGAVRHTEPSSAPAIESTADTGYANIDLPPVHGHEPTDDIEPAEPLVLEHSKDADLPVAEPEIMAVAASDEMSSAELSSDELFSDESSSDEPASEVATNELLDVEDFAFGVSDAAGDNAPESEPSHVAESFESSFDVSAESEPIHAAESIDVEGLSEELPAEASAPEVAPEPEIELATDVILGLSDDGLLPEAPAVPSFSDLEAEPSHAAGEDLTHAIDQLEGLETFSIDAPLDAPVSASDEVEAPAAPDTFATETMADLYAQQGHLESAIEIYEQLLERSPEDAELRRRASEVERQLYGVPDAPAAEPVEESFTASATAESMDTESAKIATPAFGGPTIREFFRGLLNGPGAPEASESTEAESAESMSDASSLESEGSLDILFSDATTADADLSAATSLAQAFGGEEERRDSTALHGTPAHQATDELSLDHVFRSATPAKGSAATGAFSLDQFFAGETGNAGGPDGSSEGAPPRSSDDVAQFNAWLSGLKKT